MKPDDRKPEDLCPRPDFLPPLSTQPMSPPIYPAAVYRCENPEQASGLLAGDLPGYVYSRDGHPNADLLADKCRLLHGAQHAAICGSGMSALAAAVVSQTKAGDRVVASRHLYGRSLQLLTDELSRFGVNCKTVDTCDLPRTREVCEAGVSLLVVETISNPLVRVADIASLAEIVHSGGGRLLVDNSFAGPTVCQPLSLGADLVMESLTKIMNGHSDVLLGMLAGNDDVWERVPQVISAWGFSANPFDCWLAARGLATLALRAKQANLNAMQVAAFLSNRAEVERVHFPGEHNHLDHSLAVRQFGGQFGTIVTFTLSGGTEVARRFIAAANQIPFSPSLGDLSTTLSHPESTSHRGLTPDERAALGISGGTIRLSVGIESVSAITDALVEGLQGSATST